MKVGVFGDILCPWCFIGKRRIEAAASQVGGIDLGRIAWRSYELDPTAGREPGPTAAVAMAAWWGDRTARRIAQVQEQGELEGLKLNLHVARPVSSFDAHRLVHLAAEHELASTVLDALFHAYHTDGQNIADPEVLERVGLKSGLRTADVREVLSGDTYASAVRSDERRATALGVSSVPSIVIDGGAPISGTQSTSQLRRLFEHAHSMSRSAGTL